MSSWSNQLEPLLGKDLRSTTEQMADKLKWKSPFFKSSVRSETNVNYENNEEEKTSTICASLTLTERLIGCFSCIIAGYIISIGSFVRFLKLLTGNPTPFVVMWTAGNILSLAGSTFLVGPTRQIKNMMHETRKVASITYLGSMFLTFIVIILAKIKGRDKTSLVLSFTILLLMILQFAAVTWYSLSYIPYSREIISKMLGSNRNKDSYQVIV